VSVHETERRCGPCWSASSAGFAPAVWLLCIGCASGAPNRLDSGPAPDPSLPDATPPPADAAPARDASMPRPMPDEDAGSDEATDARTPPASDEDGGSEDAAVGPCDDCQKPDPSCANLMLQHAGHHYYVCPGLKTWDEARAACRTDPRFDLIRIDDEPEQTFLETSITSLTNDTWINATDTTAADSWAWMDDGTVFWMGDSTGAAVGGGYNDWFTGEPSGSGDCARHTVLEDAWADSDCAEMHFFVCEAAP
jgi:hypothetical protein